STNGRYPADDALHGVGESRPERAHCRSDELFRPRRSRVVAGPQSAVTTEGALGGFSSRCPRAADLASFRVQVHRSRLADADVVTFQLLAVQTVHRFFRSHDLRQFNESKTSRSTTLQIANHL